MSKLVLAMPSKFMSKGIVIDQDVSFQLPRTGLLASSSVQPELRMKQLNAQNKNDDLAII
ncbi:hypothetical protein [Gelidibacter sediminis]|uniref:hypothetical protein n=1 Tax=Gelidibacter sediminis TaxID=1608710 RepID=UPI00105CB8AB|nr:hypothetical protein [Gelidibacter sediminis]